MYSSGNASVKLRPVGDSSDPFTSLTPFASSPFASSPFSAPYRGHLVGRPGMSKELAILTENGKIKPNIMDALDAHNLPFVEFCRQAKEDDWGVIKVKNVGRPVLAPNLELTALDSILGQSSGDPCFSRSQCQTCTGAGGRGGSHHYGARHE